MATLNLGRVRLNFKGDYVDLNGQTLVFFDAVTYAGSLYVVKVQNVVVDDTDNGNRPPTINGQTSFIKITNGVSFVGIWAGDSNNESTRIYYKNEITRYGANSYIALQEVPIGRSNPNTEVINATGYWSELVKGFGNYVPNFNGTQQLSIGDIFRWKGSVYLTIDEVVLAGKTPTTDPDSFDRLDNGLAPQGAYVEGRLYNFLDTVNFHGKTYAVIEPFGTINQPIVVTDGTLDPNWELLTEGFQFAGEWNDPVNGYYPNDVITFNGGVYIVIEKTFQFQNPTNTPSKFDVLIPNDAVRESDFNTDGFIVRANGNLAVDSTEYLAENQTITLTGDIEGSGKTDIDVNITVTSITDKLTASADLVRQNTTRVLAAVDTGDGNLVLRQINPSHVLTNNIVTTFNDSKGIERLAEETGSSATLSLNTNAITTLTSVGTALDGLADIISGDEFLIRDDSDNSLKALSYQQLLEKINSQITGPVNPGVTNFSSLLDTPTTYTGQANAFVKVNTAENALEFVEDDIFLQILVFG